MPLTFDQFRFSRANALGEPEARELYKTYSVPGSAAPIFQAATANLNPWTDVKVDTLNPDHGELLIISGEKGPHRPVGDRYGSYKRQKRNPGVTEILELSTAGTR